MDGRMVGRCIFVCVDGWVPGVWVDGSIMCGWVHGQLRKEQWEGQGSACAPSWSFLFDDTSALHSHVASLLGIHMS